ncbi:MAG: crotonase/enoyl-CoA hydratase family protein [Acidimicrobiales bacterium]
MSVDLTEAGGYLVATVDDGKVNVLSFELIDRMREAIAAASGQGQPLVITGRDGCFSAGFDLGVMNSGDKDLGAALFSAGAVLYRELVEAPVPIVAACTGHALAGGALLLLSADYRIGRVGPYRLGLNEVAIGMALPSFAIAMATYRLERRFLTPATMFAEVASPERAVDMGFLDELADDPLTRARSLATTLAALPRGAFATTKRRVWRGLRQELAALERQP